MIDREPPNAAAKRGASLRLPLQLACWAGRAAGGLLHPANRRTIGVQEPANGKSRFDLDGHRAWRCSRYW